MLRSHKVCEEIQVICWRETTSKISISSHHRRPSISSSQPAWKHLELIEPVHARVTRLWEIRSGPRVCRGSLAYGYWTEKFGCLGRINTAWLTWININYTRIKFAREMRGEDPTVTTPPLPTRKTRAVRRAQWSMRGPILRKGTHSLQMRKCTKSIESAQGMREKKDE